MSYLKKRNAMYIGIMVVHDVPAIRYGNKVEISSY